MFIYFARMKVNKMKPRLIYALNGPPFPAKQQPGNNVKIDY